MEIYGFYNSSSLISEYFGVSTPHSKIWGIVIAFTIWLALFTLQGFGLSAMAKRRGIGKRWQAFCPFVNLLYIGKLAGECSVFGQRVKRAGLYTMIAQIVVTVLCGLLIASEIYLYNVCGMPTTIALADNPLYYVLDWENLTGFSAMVESYYANSDYFLTIIQLVYEIFLLVLVIGLYKKYAPRNYMVLSFLCLFIPASRFIVIFVLRNRKAIDYDAYMRARREEYMRQRQQYGYGGYGGGYGYRGSPYANPYGNPYAPQPPTEQPPKPEDPFEEFSTEKGENADKPVADDPDEFFN